MSEAACPRCGNLVTEFLNIDPAIAQKIAESGNTESLPEQVCNNCFTQLAGSLARGGVLMAREKAKEQKRLMLWKSRVSLVKRARACMNEKMFSDAAVAYEKYLKVLEMVFEIEHGTLAPDHFRDSARTQELTVVASTYWDLLRIYDTSSKYGDRQEDAGKKLALFLKFTPIYPDIMKRAEAFTKTAKNPAAFKNFIKLAKAQKTKCFIATSAFGNDLSPEVIFLQNYRDQFLLSTPAGRLFVNTYYRISPSIANFLDKMPSLKAPVRATLRWLIRFLAQRHQIL